MGSALRPERRVREGRADMTEEQARHLCPTFDVLELGGDMGHGQTLAFRGNAGSDEAATGLIGAHER